MSLSCHVDGDGGVALNSNFPGRMPGVVSMLLHSVLSYILGGWRRDIGLLPACLLDRIDYQFQSTRKTNT